MRLERVELPPTADFHVHLRDGPMMGLVVPTIRPGGVDTVYVMPNLDPPITTVEQALRYKSSLQALAPDVTFLMTLYLHPSITPATIAEAARAGIAGVKCYPAGVTTNSDAGVVDLEQFYPVFKAMEGHDLVLNLHGEVPSTPPAAVSGGSKEDAVTILNAEAKFLPTLHKLHAAFPRLRIVLEHCTTRDALDAVSTCGPTVAGTITAHHLWITIDDVCGDAFCFCKPVAKTPADRFALMEAAVGCRGHGRFFFGSDSAPHRIAAKTGTGKAAAGCFTQKWATQLVIGALREAIALGWIDEQEVTREALEGFLSHNGRKFYKIDRPDSDEGQRIVLEMKGEKIAELLQTEDTDVALAPFRRGKETLSLTWTG